MLHTKSQCHQPPGSGEDFYRVFFTIYGYVDHLGHVTTTICKNFGKLIVRSLKMKFEFNWPDVSEKTMFYYVIDGTPIRVTLAERSKANLDLWNLFIVIVSFG